MKILLVIVLWIFVAKFFIWLGKIMFKDNNDKFYD